MLADDWAFWVLAAVIVVSAAAVSPRYPQSVQRARRWAVRRGLISLPTGQRLAARAPRAWSEPGWLGFLLGAWVVLGPWIWGYSDAAGAVATDAITGGVVITIALLGILFPAVWALNLLAGLWLMTAPWLVGYGSEGGPVGLSDTAAGLALSVIAVVTLATAERALATGGGSRAIGRLSTRRDGS
jgi:hypothetical protein